MPGQLLDVNKTYVTKDSNEIWWNFKYETIPGVGMSWSAYRRKPGESNFFCVGQWEEVNVYQWILDNGFSIKEDDREDLLIWLNTGGLEEIFTHHEVLSEGGTGDDTQEVS